MHTKSILFAASLAVSHVSAWGAVGHQTVALIAKNYLTSATKTWVNGILGSQAMEDVATWADSYRYTANGRWSAPLHYIDANDKPPHSCGVDYDRDCGAEGCIVRAIMNYTTLVTGKDDSVHNEALKFLIHFFGDITQPLHCEALDVGGNKINVTWDGKGTNLHSCWDQNIPEKLAGGSTMTSSKSWSKKIIKEIDSGSYKSQIKDWTRCTDIHNAQKCAMDWATDSNAYICSEVLTKGVSWLESPQNDLYPTYYTESKDIVQAQIAKGGYRLAVWLNNLASESKKKNTHLTAW